MEMVTPDVVEEILIRLPVEHLLRCKCVCKSWYSLISSPLFIKTHRKIMCNKEDGRRVAMITSYIYWEVLTLTGERYNHHVPREWQYYNSWSIEGSSNGLVLYSGCENKVCVTNPATREFRELDMPIRTPEELQCMGFGYDSSTDDYKVVLATCIQGNTLVRILSLKSNTWNIFGQINYRLEYVYHEPGILLNGALHWFWFDANGKAVIVSFNLTEEKFRDIPQPDDTRYVWDSDCTLGIMDGRLCIYIDNDDDDNEEDVPSCGTWVIKNYDANPYWELFCEMTTDHAIHYILNNDTSESTMMPTFSCDENIELSRSKENISSPIFVQTLVSPYVINYGGPSYAKNNKSTRNAGNLEEKREIEEVYILEDKEQEKEIVTDLMEEQVKELVFD